MLKNKRNLFRIILVILMIISSVFVFSGCGKKDENNQETVEEAYLQPLKNYFDGVKNKDVNQILKAFPDFMDMANKVTPEEIDSLYKQYEIMYGANIKIDYSFGEATALVEEDLSELESELSTMYNKEENIDITAGYLVPVTVTITGDGVEENKQENATEPSTENATEPSAENTDASSEEATETESNNNIEQDDMYVLQYNGNWYIM